MSTQITKFLDISGIGVGFETGTLCGSCEVAEAHDTPMCFTIKTVEGSDSSMIVMPKYQALLVAEQIAREFGYKLGKYNAST